MIESVLTSKRVVVGDQVREAWLGLREGRIAAIWYDRREVTPAPVRDLGNLVLMAGVVDPHVHINEPGRTDWEGFDRATRAAMAGGVTTLVEMPLNASPVTTTVQAWRLKLAHARNNLHVHGGFWGGVIPGNQGELEGLAAAGVLGYKAFLTHSGIDEFPNVTEHDLRIAMPVIAAKSLPLLVHCELESAAPTLVHGDSRSYHRYLSSRPPAWERDAIALLLRLCEEYRCRVHIVHLSAAESLPLIRQAKERGLPVTVETAQHYLYFNSEGIADGQTQFKCAPPIRDNANRLKLWEALLDGTIDFVATDHSPAPPAMKAVESGDFSLAWGGISSLQLALPALWTAGEPWGITLSQVARWLSEHPARMLPARHKKGRIQTGFDADLIAWDPGESLTVTPASILHRHKVTPYLHERLRGVVHQTWLKGRQVYEKDRFMLERRGEVLL